jgi:hypothetical protein
MRFPLRQIESFLPPNRKPPHFIHSSAPPPPPGHLGLDFNPTCIAEPHAPYLAHVLDITLIFLLGMY